VDVFLAVVCLLVLTNKQTNHGKKHIHLGFYTGTGGCNPKHLEQRLNNKRFLQLVVHGTTKHIFF
jgi:hypothetical protein